ncbi:zinc-ribbon domain-containing protein [Chloroflexota bacterium]
MSFQDKSLLCCDCRIYFTFTSGEQRFHASKGFSNEPVRCPLCRRINKAKSTSNRTNRYALR